VLFRAYYERTVSRSFELRFCSLCIKDHAYNTDYSLQKACENFGHIFIKQGVSNGTKTVFMECVKGHSFKRNIITFRRDIKTGYVPCAVCIENFCIEQRDKYSVKGGESL